MDCELPVRIVDRQLQRELCGWKAAKRRVLNSAVLGLVGAGELWLGFIFAGEMGERRQKEKTREEVGGKEGFSSYHYCKF